MSYQSAKQEYAKYGINTEDVLELLSKIPVSVHCWQGDDVIGFDGTDSLDGGIQTTGNYPGKARNQQELFDDIRRAYGGNTFSVQYKGDSAALIERLSGVCDVLEDDAKSTGFSTLKIHIERNEDVRSVVAQINDAVEMRQFVETMPSMNDIFIRAVNE